MTHRDVILLAQIRADLAAGRARQARRDAGVKVCEVARAVGVTPQAVSGWESGRRVPRQELALAYGRLLAALTRRAA